MKKTAIVLGAGSRGNAYAHYSLSFPEQLQIVGVAEPDADHRRVFAETSPNGGRRLCVYHG